MPSPQLQVANCPCCGKVFQKNHRNQCIECSREIDAALNKCFDYLRRNHKSTEEQLTEATGVSAKYIQGWIKEGRLLITDYPNLNYPCCSCGAPIRKHKMCVDCSLRLNKEIQQLNEKEELRRYRGPLAAAESGFQIRERIGRLNRT
ncbi:flagellar protein [Paenibacillus eucommiae]|uniref:Ribosomal protein L32 n=1 Tax=Paenibacillus eucommiae TaxID=1355755 RepID=A0ABS4IN17_9BACL|nr:flagellar protein [Paenibacillus eucommiae]MBP1988959.1 ribosomal protein L32 [Paenibacillus eucommiae]